MRRIILMLVTATMLATATAAWATARGSSLTATVGPGFTISMSAKSVKAGKYIVVVHDKSAIHDFHLTGPGVNKKTGVGFVGTVTWKVTLEKGTYTFVCDPHKALMHGKLKVT